MADPRTPELENAVFNYLQRFQSEYDSFQDKLMGQERQARLKEELRAYTNDERSEEVRRRAVEVWNNMVAARGIGFGEAKEFVPRQVEVMTEAVVQGIDPLMGQVAPTRSKKFKSAIKMEIKNYFSKMVGGLTLPAQGNKTLNAELKTYSPLVESADYKEFNFSKISDVRTDRSELATYQCDFSDPNIPAEEKKYIIHFNGNLEIALGKHDEMLQEAQNHQCVVINFDYPGVGHSTGKSTRSKHMVDAGVAQVQRLIKMGVPAENILLKGQSIGGGVATLTAAKFHQEGHRVNLYNQRSFSKLSTAAKYLAPLGLGNVAARIIKATGWEMDSLKAWKKIPDAYKDFCFAVNDTVIPADKAGLAGALGKFDDKDRRLEDAISFRQGKPPKPIKAGHNTRIYGSNRLQQPATVKNANGMPAMEMFDNFVKKALFTEKVTINLDDAQKKQVDHLIHSLNRQPSSPSTKLSFHSNQKMLEKVFGKNGPQVMNLLESIKQEGKITNKQLSVLENYCERAQKKMAKDPSIGSFVVNANELIKAIKVQQDPSLRRSQSVRQ